MKFNNEGENKAKGSGQGMEKVSEEKGNASAKDIRYSMIEDTASDLAFEAYGKSLNELFENSAKALFSIICDIKNVKPIIKKHFSFKSKEIKEMLINWLEALLASVDIDNMFYSNFKVDVKQVKPSSEDNIYTLKATASGEKASSKKAGTVVKGITYHDFSIKRTRGRYIARVVCDI